MRAAGPFLLLALVVGALSPGGAADTAPTGPLTLPQAIARALQLHPDLASARAAVMQARAQATQTSSELWPQLSAQWSASESQSLARPINVGGGTIVSSGSRTTQRDADVSLDYTLYRSGRSAQISQARTRVAASQAGLQDAQRELVYSVQNAYYSLLTARQQATVALKNVANAERHLELVQARLDAGTVPASDLLPIKAEVARARLSGVQAETTLGVAESALRALLVLPAGSPLDLAEPLPATATIAPVAELLEQAHRNRPDLAQQTLSLRASQLGTKAAREQAGLQFSAGASADWGRHTGTTGETWRLEAGVSYPLFDAGASRATVTAAQASEETSRQQLAALQLQLQQEVESAALQAHQAQTAVAVAGVSRQEAESALGAAEARYREGLALIIEVTDAQVQLYQAELAELQARYDLAVALAELQRVTATQSLPAAGDLK